jgi:hypothetical protein
MSALADLAKQLAVADRQRRLLGRDIIAIAGTLGMIQPASDGALTITLSRRADHWLQRDLVDAGVLSRVFGTDIYRMRRMPDGPDEQRALRKLLGLAREWEAAQ